MLNIDAKIIDKLLVSVVEPSVGCSSPNLKGDYLGKKSESFGRLDDVMRSRVGLYFGNTKLCNVGL